jgi:hypothetical protein
VEKIQLLNLKFLIELKTAKVLTLFPLLLELGKELFQEYQEKEFGD